MDSPFLVFPPSRFLAHKPHTCFVGQDVIEMRPGELSMFLHFGRPPTDFRGMDSPFTDPLIRISREGGRTWGGESAMGLTWTIDGFMSDGGKSVLRLQSGKILFVSHRHGSTF